MRVAVVAEGGAQSGLGHLARSTGLVEALSELGCEPVPWLHGGEAIRVDGVDWTPVPSNPKPAPALAVDGYSIDAAGLRRRLGAHVVTALHGRRAEKGVDLAVDPLALSLPGVLGGFEHCCLRRAYWDAGPHVIGEDVRSVLVTLGGATPREQIEAILSAVLAGASGAAVECVVGPFSGDVRLHGVKILEPTSELAALMAEADLVVTGAGQTLLEAAALGRPSIAICVAADQREQLAQVSAAGATVASDLDSIALDMRRLAAEKALRQGIADAGRVLIDGRGAFRVAGRILELLAGRRHPESIEG